MNAFLTSESLPQMDMTSVNTAAFLGGLGFYVLAKASVNQIIDGRKNQAISARLIFYTGGIITHFLFIGFPAQTLEEILRGSCIDMHYNEGNVLNTYWLSFFTAALYVGETIDGALMTPDLWIHHIVTVSMTAIALQTTSASLFLQLAVLVCDISHWPVFMYQLSESVQRQNTNNNDGLRLSLSSSSNSFYLAVVIWYTTFRLLLLPAMLVVLWSYAVHHSDEIKWRASDVCMLGLPVLVLSFSILKGDALWSRILLGTTKKMTRESDVTAVPGESRCSFSDSYSEHEEEYEKVSMHNSDIPFPSRVGPVKISMEKGFVNFEEMVKEARLTIRQTIAKHFLIGLVRVYRFCAKPFFMKKVRRARERWEAKYRSNKIRLPPMPSKSYTHFSEEDREEFERTGVLGPFRTASEEEAKALGIHIASNFDNKVYDGDSYIMGKDLYEAMKKDNSWNLTRAGIYIGLVDKKVRDFIRKPAIADRAAGILGPDVMCWKTQLFEKGPGEDGTFWHQNSDFQEFSKTSRLQPTVPTDSSILQVTCWTAPTDVCIETAALRILPGSFVDGRLEELYKFFQKNLLLSLSLLSDEMVDKMATVAVSATGVFGVSRAIFEAASDVLGENFDFEDYYCKDLVMKAGESVIFTSLNVHGSYPNSTAEMSRLALVARLTANTVKVGSKQSYSVGGKVWEPVADGHGVAVQWRSDTGLTNHQGGRRKPTAVPHQESAKEVQTVSKIS